MKETLTVIKALEAEGVIGRYAIGGAFAVMLYAEPVATYDLDVFCFLPQKGLLIDLNPLYIALAKQGYHPEAEQVDIEGVPVQFLVPPTPLVEEALREAVDVEMFGVLSRVFTYEHLLAIMAETGRTKDKLRIAQCLESTNPRQDALREILERFSLLEKWAKITE